MATNAPSPHLSLSPCFFFTLAGAVAAVALGWVSAELNLSGKAPAGLLSLGIGVALGLLLIALAELTRFKWRPGLICAAMLLGMLTVVSEHGWLYRAYRQKWWQNRAEQPAVAIFRPEATPLSLAGYFQREISYSPRQWMFWCVDAGVIVGSAVGIILIRNGLAFGSRDTIDESAPAENRVDKDNRS